jgi:hypothetical protein
MINNNILPYMRKDISTLVTLSAAAIGVLMLASPVLPLSNPLLLQPVQAQTVMTFKTPSPATGPGSNLAFDVYGNTSTSDPQNVEITNGTIHLQAQQRYTGEVTYGSFTNDSSGASITFSTKIDNLDYTVSSPCSSSGDNQIDVSTNTEHQSFKAQLNVLLLKVEEETLLHSHLLLLPLLWLEPPHNKMMEMVIRMMMEYLMLTITVPTFLTQDVTKKEIQH